MTYGPRSGSEVNVPIGRGETGGPRHLLTLLRRREVSCRKRVGEEQRGLYRRSFHTTVSTGPGHPSGHSGVPTPRRSVWCTERTLPRWTRAGSAELVVPNSGNVRVPFLNAELPPGPPSVRPPSLPPVSCRPFTSPDTFWSWSTFMALQGLSGLKEIEAPTLTVLRGPFRTSEVRVVLVVVNSLSKVRKEPVCSSALRSRPLSPPPPRHPSGKDDLHLCDPRDSKFRCVTPHVLELTEERSRLPSRNQYR